MSNVFLSHSSKDNPVAGEIQHWLDEKGYKPAFLDYDPQYGIPAGRSWERELYLQLRTCRVMLILWSQNWRASRWCFAELTHARALGKYIIPVKLDAQPIDEFILQDTQHIDLAAGHDEAFKRLERGLRTAGLELRSDFAWAPERPPYPGLLAFQQTESAIFFGREPEIQAALDHLNQLQRFGGASLLFLVGASGCGKSSLLNAGVLPRLKRDPDRWLVLDPFRPTQDPWQEMALALQDAFRTYGEPREWRALRDVLRQHEDEPQQAAAALCEISLDLAVAAGQRHATLLLAIDQAEEFFTTVPPTLQRRFLTFIRQALIQPERPMLMVGTLRSDFMGSFQEHPALREMSLETVPLSSLTNASLARIIEGPAELAGLELESGLVQAMLEDTRTQDALPLLAFSLREMWERFGQAGRFTVQQYREGLGGLQGSLLRVAQAVMTAQPLSMEQEQALRRSFLCLVGLDEEGRYVRRPAFWSDLPAASQEALERFVKARLLVSYGKGGERALEVAHEAFFLHWPLLRGWLDEHRRELVVREGVLRAAQDWLANGQDEAYLVHRGRRLTDALALVKDSAIKLTPDGLSYLEACRKVLETPAGDSLRDLSETGWGVIFANDADEAVRSALAPLLEHRRREATKKRRDGYREFSGSDGYRPGEKALEFLARHGVDLFTPDLSRLPYYLLIVGDPETIPFEFQYQLSTTYAVGRVHFPREMEYATYARSVVEAETAPTSLPRRIAVFAPQHAGDQASKITVSEFAKPLVRSLMHGQSGWSIVARVGESASKSEFAGLLSSREVPALLFATGHGLGYSEGDPQQPSRQGALVCSDWPGSGQVASEHIFAAGDVSPESGPHGLIAFLIGPYTAGTPKTEEPGGGAPGSEPRSIAPQAFVSRLPQRLLGHEAGGALAIVGHVERTWHGPYCGTKGGQDVEVFLQVLQNLMRGDLLGAAMRPLFRRYAEYTAQLAYEFEKVIAGRSEIDSTLTGFKSSLLYEVRNYVILGDPSVRAMATTVHDHSVEAAAATAGDFRGREKLASVHDRTDDLAEAGWGVVFPADADSRLREALGELLNQRRQQAGAREPCRYQEFFGAYGYQPAESAEGFLVRQSLRLKGENSQLPRFLLIAGGSASIPYAFQTELAARHCVGRLAFDDPQSYRHYARSVIATEKGEIRLPRQAAFFSPWYPNDRLSDLSVNKVILPLAERLEQEAQGWQARKIVGESATKLQLKRLLGAEETPALLFVVTRSGRELTLGALFCQDCPRELLRKVTPELLTYCYSGEDLSAQNQMTGMIVFLFTSWGLGDNSRTARLPQKLLSHENGAALAVVGTYEELLISTVGNPLMSDSYREGLPLDLDCYHAFLSDLTAGKRLGTAMEALQSDRLANSSWILLGDPAVRLRG